MNGMFFACIFRKFSPQKILISIILYIVVVVGVKVLIQYSINFHKIIVVS